ncbi:MAG: hypothetical protein LRY46_00650 [Candidatus Pacebacteria bacterium]|nr:hypothetical protein [Candidatus Paceibacterota bacterium]MCD8563944.1 hypothetical protein [Candidatus Paceibacterota bacterium]
MRVGYLERHRKILIEFSIQDLHHFHSGAEELYVFKNEYVFGKSESRIHDSYLRSEYMLVAQDPYHKTKIVNYVNAFVHQRIKGYKAEKRVADIIAKILDERQALPCQFYIASFMKAGKLNDTHYGIDLHITVITPSAHKIVPLQIKSSIHAQREHKQKFPKIPSLVIHQQTDAEIIQLISDILEGYVWGKIRHLS